MLCFRFVANTFVLGVVEVKLGERRCIVKQKRRIRGCQYSLRHIGEFDVEDAVKCVSGARSSRIVVA